MFDSIEMLNGFLWQVVVSRRDVGIRKWTGWLWEDLSSRPYVWLRPAFVDPSPFFIVEDPQAGSSRILVEPHLIDAEFRKAWMPFFCRSGHPVVTPDQFLEFVGHLLPQEAYLDLPRITGRDLQEVARAETSTAGGLDGWAWNEIKALPLPWFSGLAIILELVETTGVWPQSLSDAYVAMIPKVDCDSTPWVNGLSACARLCTGCGLPFGLDISKSGLRGGCLNRCIALVMVYLRWRPGSLLLWILRRFFLGLVVISCMLWSLMSLSPLILLIGLFWIVLWVAWGYLTGFVRSIFLFIVRFVSGLSLLLGLGEPWCRDGGIPQGCPLSMIFIVALYVP